MFLVIVAQHDRCFDLRWLKKNLFISYVFFFKTSEGEVRPIWQLLFPCYSGLPRTKPAAMDLFRIQPSASRRNWTHFIIAIIVFPPLWNQPGSPWCSLFRSLYVLFFVFVFPSFFLFSHISVTHSTSPSFALCCPLISPHFISHNILQRTS